MDIDDVLFLPFPLPFFGRPVSLRILSGSLEIERTASHRLASQLSTPRAPPRMALHPTMPSRQDLAPATSFAALKAKISASNDPSSSGSQDRPLVDLLRLINTSSDHFTTSSCSGRIVIYAPCDDDAVGVEPDVFDDGGSDEEDDEEGKGKARSRTQNGKGGGSWLFVSHEEVRPFVMVSWRRS